MTDSPIDKAFRRFERWHDGQPIWKERFQAQYHLRDGGALQDPALTDEQRQTYWDEIDGADRNTLTNFARDDFFCRRFGPEAETVIEAYLRAQGWKEDARTRSALLARQAMRFGIVQVPMGDHDEDWEGGLLRARDLLQEGGTVMLAWDGDEEPYPGEIVCDYLLPHEGHWDMTASALVFGEWDAASIRQAIAETGALAPEALEAERLARQLPATEAVFTHLRQSALAQRLAALFARSTFRYLEWLPETGDEAPTIEASAPLPEDRSTSA